MLVAGGAAGTLARYYLARGVGGWSGSDVIGIFAVNMLGSFAIGLFLTLAQDRFDWSDQVRLLVATGFLGGFTTFSALTWQSLDLLESRDVASAALNLVGSVVIGMLAVTVGAALARSV